MHIHHTPALLRAITIDESKICTMHTHARTHGVPQEHGVLTAVHQLHPLVQRPVHPCKPIDQSNDANKMRDLNSSDRRIEPQHVLPNEGNRHMQRGVRGTTEKPRPQTHQPRPPAQPQPLVASHQRKCLQTAMKTAPWHPKQAHDTPSLVPLKPTSTGCCCDAHQSTTTQKQPVVGYTHAMQPIPPLT
jgi:hypothetical protein